VCEELLLDHPDASDHLDDLVRQLEHARRELWESADKTTGRWTLWLGPIRVRRSFYSGHIALFFLAFCALTILGGGVLALIEPTKELGIALVVGGIFAFGSSIVQVWAVQMQRESEGDVTKEKEVARLRALSNRVERLAAEVEARDPGYMKRRLQEEGDDED
jgi:hypothetical protein